MKEPPLIVYTAARNRPLADDAYESGKAALFTLRSYRGQPFERNDPLCGASSRCSRA